MSTYFPIGEELRGMISAGNGFAGLTAVALQTVIRSIVYASASGTVQERKATGESLSFWIFFGCFYAMLAVALCIAFFVPKMETFQYFEKKAKALQEGGGEANQASAGWIPQYRKSYSLKQNTPAASMAVEFATREVESFVVGLGINFDGGFQSELSFCARRLFPIFNRRFSCLVFLLIK